MIAISPNRGEWENFTVVSVGHRLPLGDETFGTGAIIGTTLGGLAALIAFITILLVIIICYHQR